MARRSIFIKKTDPSLVLRWQLDSANGANDLSGNGHNGTAQGGVTIGGQTDHNGNISGATLFDGVDDLIKSLSDLGLNGTNKVTMCLWFKTGTGQTNKYLCGMTKDFSHNGLDLSLQGATTVQPHVVASSTFSPATGVTYANSAWHFLAVTYDGSQGILYMDGSLIGGPGAVTGNMTLTSDFCAGAPASGSAAVFTGYLSDVRVYNRALSAAELLAIYNS
jgi:hypothetical protein